MTTVTFYRDIPISVLDKLKELPENEYHLRLDEVIRIADGANSCGWVSRQVFENYLMGIADKSICIGT